MQDMNKMISAKKNWQKNSNDKKIIIFECFENAACQLSEHIEIFLTTLNVIQFCFEAVRKEMIL